MLKQMKKAKKSINKLKAHRGKLFRDIQKNLGQIQKDLNKAWLKTNKIKNPKFKDKNKTLPWDDSEGGAYISKRKRYKPYEFGCKASVITSGKGNKGGKIALIAMALHEIPYDDHTLKSAINEYEKTAGVKPRHIYVDKGF